LTDGDGAFVELRHWHLASVEQTVRALHGDAVNGLSPEEAHRRLERYGPNDISTGPKHSLARLIGRQFTDFMIVVLIVAAAISGVLGELRDAIAILVIVALNGAFGAIQEFRAQRAVEALRRMSAPMARVVRNGTVMSVPSRVIVTGDLVLLESGDVVPADVRLLAESDLRIDESALTGESLSVEKSVAELSDSNSALGDRSNMAYKDTLITRGTASAIVVATGQKTETGRIADMLKDRSGIKTPLQQRIARFGRQLSLVILALCTVIFFVGLLQGQPPLLMFLTAVSLAVAAVPEALPAVVTISLALGAHKLTQRNTLVRKLPAVEALGSVTYICADKTGTLTENRMAVDRIYAAGQTLASLPTADGADPAWQHIGQALALNNEVRTMDGGLRGDPTELALLRAAEDAGFIQSRLLARLPRIAELSFDEDRKRMTTLHRYDTKALAYIKGAPETVLPLCKRAFEGDGTKPFEPGTVIAEANDMAAKGYRVLAIALRDFATLPAEKTPESIESGLSFLGLVGLIDPPRAEARQAVSECRSAGIVPVMITGDHPETARHIAERLGIAETGTTVMSGTALEKLTDSELQECVRDMRVYARVNPEQKIRIVSALAEAGEFVAMTGDGVNDAPALKRAAIGIAMGKRGTDVAREAADMVLLDDNFATIVAAVREGRRIFDDIRKFITYTMTSNSGEIWTLLLAPFLGLPIPLLPIHILWVNLLTDGLPGLAFAAEPAERNIMRRPPKPPEENILVRRMWPYMLWMGLLIGGLSIAGQFWTYHRGVEYWQTMTFTILVVAQLFNAYAVRSERDSILQLGVLSNPQLLGAVVLTFLLQLAAIYVPALNMILMTQPLPVFDLAVAIALGSVVLVAAEIHKWLRRP